MTHVRAQCRQYKRRREKEEEEADRKRKRLDRNDRRDSDCSRHQRDKDRHRRDDSSDEKDYQTHRRDDSRGEKDYQKERKGYSYKSSTEREVKKPSTWYADSGATQHMTDNRALLTNFVPTGPEKWSVSGIGESSLTVAGQGDVILTATVNGEHLHGKIRGVLYVPGLGINLYSIGTATDADLKVIFDDDTVSFSQDDVVIMEGKREGKKTLYQLNIQAKENQHNVERALSAAQVASLSLWHQRFGHLNHKTVLRMATMGSVTALALFNDKLHLSTHCRGCLLGKMSRASFLSTRTRGTHIGDIVHSDVCGPIQICTPSGARFFEHLRMISRAFVKSTC
jgi:hypothetical protein